MKKLILILTVLFLTNFVDGQTNVLDTVRVRNLTMQAQDWAWLVGKNSSSINQDSVAIVAFRNIRAAVQTVQNPQWTTNVTIDSIPGRIVLAFYQTAMTANAGEVVSRYTAITNAISAKTVLSYWIGRIDGNVSGDFIRHRNTGKQILIDQ